MSDTVYLTSKTSEIHFGAGGAPETPRLLDRNPFGVVSDRHHALEHEWSVVDGVGEPLGAFGSNPNVFYPNGIPQASQPVDLADFGLKCGTPYLQHKSVLQREVQIISQ